RVCRIEMWKQDVPTSVGAIPSAEARIATRLEAQASAKEVGVVPHHSRGVGPSHCGLVIRACRQLGSVECGRRPAEVLAEPSAKLVSNLAQAQGSTSLKK